MWLIQKHYKIETSKNNNAKTFAQQQSLLADRNPIRLFNINMKDQTDGLSSSILCVACSLGRACQERGELGLLRSQLTISSDVEWLVSKLNLGSLGYTKTVAAEAEGVNAAEYRTEVTVIFGNC